MSQVPFQRSRSASFPVQSWNASAIDIVLAVCGCNAGVMFVVHGAENGMHLEVRRPRVLTKRSRIIFRCRGNTAIKANGSAFSLFENAHEQFDFIPRVRLIE